ncbi:Na/Pi cotransporter family protein [Marivita sp. XM-24bin2]|jgi:phosphate:Na+ symporter|uniref:Na/Pi cotransporter family protein n=1 Tax=Marivita sp. XM-24bin2 TaxID=2133951 RepID=UPI000D799BA3|nr:Na/Pi cotransporter family protein [Marivita sp. XM-24bin2]PWL36698.1 MAG: Na/Pi cotransporter family protein [Marivita sp. XM-24bin2]
MIILAAQLAAAVALLLWSTRLIRTGVERAFMPELKLGLKSLSGNTLSAAAGGGLAAMVMQSATAVALISAGFAISGMLAPHSALALVLGAELGSALMARVLILPVETVLPFALLIGVIAFFKASTRKMKQIGRIIIGLALVFISLGMIREATMPIGENAIIQSIATYFRDDLISAYVLGAVLTWAMHSSLAAVLTFATFATTGIIAAPVAAALVVGANLGGAFIPFALLWSAERPARLLALGNLLARGTLTVVFLAILLSGRIDLALFGATAGEQAIALHIMLNATLLLLALPLVKLIIQAAGTALPRHSDEESGSLSALDTDALDHPPLALACAQRELLRMSETVQAILVPVMHLFRTWDPEQARMIERREDEIDRMHFETKIYVSRLREHDLHPDQDKKTLEIVAMANSLEDAADRIAVTLVALAKKMSDEALSFSDEGLADIAHFHDQIVTNGQLALSVMTTGDAEAARQLVAEKDRIRIEEQKLQERHLKRLQQGATASIETSNIHQETLRVLKQINAAVSYVAYPIAKETGDLLDSRLVRPRSVGGSG